MSGGKLLSFVIGFMLSNEKARDEVVKMAKKTSAYIDNKVNDKLFKKEKEDDRRNNDRSESGSNNSNIKAEDNGQPRPTYSGNDESCGLGNSNQDSNGN